MTLRVQSPDELIAAVDHIMGFHVEDSITVIPVSPGLPGSRLDLPTNQADRTEMVNTLLRAYGRSSGGAVMVIGFADSPSQVEPGTHQLCEALAGVGVGVRGRLWAGDQRWTDLDSGVSGIRSATAANRIAAEMVAEGRKAPAASRAAVDQEFIGNPEPVTRYLPAVAGDMENSTPARERQWAIGRAEAFLEDGHSLTDPQAARMLACLQSVTVRDQLSQRISTETAHSWSPLWDNLTRRSPDELVAPAATLSAISNWCQGDGARAWAALDRILADQRAADSLAGLVASALQCGVHPGAWDQARSAAPVYPPIESREISDARRQPPEPTGLANGRPPAGPGR
ncbi:hypothetical protein GCM10028772_02960 [Nocardioides ultimimeridianus]